MRHFFLWHIFTMSVDDLGHQAQNRGNRLKDSSNQSLVCLLQTQQVKQNDLINIPFAPVANCERFSTHDVTRTNRGTPEAFGFWHFSFASLQLSVSDGFSQIWVDFLSPGRFFSVQVDFFLSSGRCQMLYLSISSAQVNVRCQILVFFQPRQITGLPSWWSSWSWYSWWGVSI